MLGCFNFWVKYGQTQLMGLKIEILNLNQWLGLSIFDSNMG